MWTRVGFGTTKTFGQVYLSLTPRCAKLWGVTLRQFLAVGNSNASGITLSKALRQISDWFQPAACNRAQRSTAAFTDAGGQRKTCEPSKSPLRQVATKTERNFWEIKLAHRPKSFWYPYSTLHNVAVLEKLSAAAGLNLLELCRGACGKVADIGAADGDLAFFLERQGLSVDVIDNEYTNFNGLEGARTLKEALNSSVAIRSVDLDSQFSLAGQEYDAVFFLGTLYHVKNPFFLLECLARITKYCFVSTRIAKQTADGQSLSRYPVAYLLGPQECNNDDTNFWIFSDHGLKRLIERTGWNLLSYFTIGDTISSTPADPDHDERAFCLLEKRPPILSANPNPVPATKEAGKTMISWDTADGSIGRVFVSVNGGQEVLFADGRHGSAPAHWIETGSNYEFRLYDSDHTRLLDKVVVAAITQ